MKGQDVTKNTFSRDCIVFSAAILVAMLANDIGYIIIASLLLGALINAVLEFVLERRKPSGSGWTPPEPMPPAYKVTREQIAAAGEKALREMRERGELPVTSISTLDQAKGS